MEFFNSYKLIYFTCFSIRLNEYVLSGRRLWHDRSSANGSTKGGGKICGMATVWKGAMMSLRLRLLAIYRRWLLRLRHRHGQRLHCIPPEVEGTKADVAIQLQWTGLWQYFKSVVYAKLKSCTLITVVSKVTKYTSNPPGAKTYDCYRFLFVITSQQSSLLDTENRGVDASFFKTKNQGDFSIWAFHCCE